MIHCWHSHHNNCLLILCLVAVFATSIFLYQDQRCLTVILHEIKGLEIPSCNTLICQGKSGRRSVMKKIGMPYNGITVIPSMPRAINETIRFVLFLCDAEFYIGAISLLESLTDSLKLTSLPPLIVVIGKYTIQPSQRQVLERLGAQVKFVEIPNDLKKASAQHALTLNSRWPQSVLSKILLFRPQIVESHIIWYMDLDTIARGNVIDCMRGTIDLFRNRTNLNLMAVGSRTYFNNGVVLARASDTTYKYMVDMLRNGTCVGRICNETTTMMKRRVYTDQDVFIEFTQRFPEQFEPIHKGSAFNLEARFYPNERDDHCSIIHYTGSIKPWSVLFPDQNMTRVCMELPSLSDNFVVEQFKNSQLKGRKSPGAFWTINTWSDHWNRAVMRLRQTGWPRR